MEATVGGRLGGRGDKRADNDMDREGGKKADDERERGGMEMRWRGRRKAVREGGRENGK